MSTTRSPPTCFILRNQFKKFIVAMLQDVPKYFLIVIDNSLSNRIHLDFYVFYPRYFQHSHKDLHFKCLKVIHCTDFKVQSSSPLSKSEYIWIAFDKPVSGVLLKPWSYRKFLILRKFALIILVLVFVCKSGSSLLFKSWWWNYLLSLLCYRHIWHYFCTDKIWIGIKRVIFWHSWINYSAFSSYFNIWSVSMYCRFN